MMRIARFEEESILCDKEEREGGSNETEKEESTPACCAKKNEEDIMLRLGIVRACHGINKKLKRQRWSNILSCANYYLLLR